MKDDRVYLINILESIEKIQSYTQIGKEDFMKSSITQDAVIRNLEIIGEATKKISDVLRNDYKDIPWRKMAGLRDILIHAYMGVDLKTVWNVVEKELPQLKVSIRDIVE